MKVVIINKSDSTGGAAVVSYRLMEALRKEGVDAYMLVCEKISNSPYVHLAANKMTIQRNFFTERLKIFISNGFNRKTLFKIDTGDEGLPLWRHPLVKNADAILLNWINQGMLSLKGVNKILRLGKPVVWTMHDMWCMTGICHHAGTCNHFKKECGDCPLLGAKAFPDDLSHKIHERKSHIFSDKDLMNKMAFVAVSSWLKSKAKESSLLYDRCVEVIPNAFDIKSISSPKKKNHDKVRILFGAARLDDPIKGLDTLRETSQILKKRFPDEAGNMEIAMFGNIKDSSMLRGFGLPLVMLGVLQGENEIRKAYEAADILVSASSYETLPGTLVEAQAYGCVPVSFNQGGQSDIIKSGIHHSSSSHAKELSDLDLGIITRYSENMEIRAHNLAEGIIKALSIVQDKELHAKTLQAMRVNVENSFSYHIVAQNYISLIEKLMSID